MTGPLDVTADLAFSVEVEGREMRGTLQISTHDNQKQG